MNRIMLALGLLLAGLGLAAARGEEPETGQLRVGDKLVPVAQYRGQTYRLVEPELLGRDPNLPGQLVCVEGKLKDVHAHDFGLYGTDLRPALGPANLLKGLEPGNNLWIGGKLERSGNELIFTAQVAVKLKTDPELFEDRFAAAQKAADWERMLDLAGWINRSKSYNPKISYEEDRQYRACRDRAVLAARTAAEAAFRDADAAGYSRLAGRLAELGVEREVVWRYWRRAAWLDPEQAAAAAKLAEAGFVRWRGLWVTREDKARLEAVEEGRALRLREERAGREKRRLEEAVSGAPLYARGAAELETALAALPAPEAAARLASEIQTAVSARLGRRELVLVAALPVRQQAAPLAAAMKSAEPEIRLAALELAAARGDAAARRLVAEAAAGDGAEEVVERACRLLAAAGDAESLERLVGLTGAESEPRARAAVEALRAATGQDRFTPIEWRIWWGRNKSAYPAAPAE